MAGSPGRRQRGSPLTAIVAALAAAGWATPAQAAATLEHTMKSQSA